MLCAHGTAFDVGMTIAKNGFATLASLDAGDFQIWIVILIVLGFYGKGIYFSTSASYVVPYCATKTRPSILVSLVISGNPYPVIESPHELKVCRAQASSSAV